LDACVSEVFAAGVEGTLAECEAMIGIVGKSSDGAG
jgi:hypothetical protein